MGLTERIARACAAHPRRTFAAWAGVAILSLAAVVLLLNGLTTDAHVTNNPESVRAISLIDRAFPPDPRTQVSDVVIVSSEVYRATDPAFKTFAASLYAAVLRTRGVHGGRLYFQTHDPTLVARDGHAAVITLDVASDNDAKPVVRAVERADRNPDFSVAITGLRTLNNDFNSLSEHDLRSGELGVGLPAALIILVLVFGAVIAGLVPLLMAVVSIVVAMGLVALLSQAFDLSIFIVNMLTGMGLALGIDYSLFVISRYREERGREREPLDAIAASGATASRAVLFSGSAFVVALFGMLLVPTTIMRSLAAGAILVGVVSVAAALTLLPALLGVLGDRVNRLRVPFLGGDSLGGRNAEGRFWRAIVDRVLRRPALSLGVATALLLAAAVPVLGLHIGASGVSTLPDRLPSKQGFLALERHFPTQNVDRVNIVVRSADSPRVQAALDRLRGQLATDPRFGPGLVRRAGDVALLSVPIRGDALGKGAIAAVRGLRARVLPRVFAGTQAEPLVSGKTAENIDYFDAVSKPAPLVFAFVLGLTLILLTIAFRSLVVALTAIFLNLLSVGAAYGLLVLVFLHGVGVGLLGFQQVSAIDAWVPLFLFSVLFGLSMDYQVFLLSRIKERYDQTGDTTDAVAWGVASTARIITGAALIIVAVFSGFATGDLVMFQQMGFGIAAALLIDATVIRSVVLPSAMQLLGPRNWYLPRWLRWLPRLEVESHAPPAPQPDPT